MELTFQPGASVAQIAQVNGVNANQVFKCDGHLNAAGWRSFLPGPQLCFRSRCLLHVR